MSSDVSVEELDEINEELEEEVKIELEGKDERAQPKVKLPKWLRLILMFLPAGIIGAIIILIDLYLWEFPEAVNPTAILALTGLGITGLVIIGDMVFRNVFVYRMLRTETKKSRIYRQIIKEKKAKKALARHDFDEDELDDDYEYDDDETEEEIEEEEIEEEEYTYEVEEDDKSHYRMKSFIMRGGLISILLVNAIFLIILAAIFQFAVYGGFETPPV